MVGITFIGDDGDVVTVHASSGMSLMEAARRSGIAGIDAICGGACSCGTCHVIVEDTWMNRIGTRNPVEVAVLEDVNEAGPYSRLACQIRIDDTLNGVVVRVPSRA